MELRFRQIHLDFHTSEHIANVGGRFDPEEFASTLEKARVNSITCFARCHHGYIYFDTKLFPERKHPHLARDLLREQIEACHARDIRVPIYTTVGWDHFTAERHPEWLCISPEGKQQGTPPYEPGFYRRLCLNTPYLEFLKSHVREILETLPTDGIFFDIVQPQDCSCYHCRKAMEEKGLNPSDQAARQGYGLQVVNEFKRDMTRFVRLYSRDCTIFYNSGHVGTRHRAVAGAYTHFELESLPSGGWGYMHFPLAARYARTLGLDCLGMTGKFHTSWGDFHSFKNKAALEFECFHMLALNAKCSVGDQLHPEGAICQATYNLIGSVYSQVEAKEPWCRDATPVTEIGVMTPEEFAGPQSGLPEQTMGAGRMLQEGAHQFDVIDSGADFSKYRLLVLPDEIPVSHELARKLEEYLSKGGGLIASYRSGLDPSGTSFALKSLGVSLKGPAPYSPDFILPKGDVGKGLPLTEHVMYLRGLEVEPAEGAKVLAEVAVPYFNRTFQHFCSHRHTPSSGSTAYPGIVRKGRAVYFAHPIFTQYNRNAPCWCKRLFLNAVEMLLPQPLVRTNAPSSALLTLNQQRKQNRWVLHLLHYIPERRGRDFDTIEDIIPLLDVSASVRLGKGVSRVTLVPSMKPLDFVQADRRVEFTVPKVEGHQMVEIALSR